MSSPPASPPSSSCSTRAWGSPSAPSTTGRCWPVSTASSGWASRCWSGPPARRSSASCSPPPTARSARPTSGTPRRWPPRCWRPRPACGGCGCTMPRPPWTPSAPSRPCEPLVHDRIAIKGLRAHGHHGVYGFERERGQMFRVDAVLELDTAPAAASDHLVHTVNYAELAKQLYAVLAGEPVKLLETLAQRLADVCLA